MTQTVQTLAPPIWYKQFWPWFLIFFPAVAVVAGIITISLAISSDDGLVNDDYYKTGLAINETLQREEHAQALNLKANVRWDTLTKSITLSLTGKLSPLPSTLKLLLAHATRANFDQNIILYLSPDKKNYTGKLKSIQQGSWITILENKEKSWRIHGRVILPKQTQWQLFAK